MYYLLSINELSIYKYVLIVSKKESHTLFVDKVLKRPELVLYDFLHTCIPVEYMKCCVYEDEDISKVIERGMLEVL